MPAGGHTDVCNVGGARRRALPDAHNGAAWREQGVALRFSDGARQRFEEEL